MAEEKEIKVKKITDKDFKKAETALKAELAKRKDSMYRQSHEQKWKVVDRQVQLEPEEISGNLAPTWINNFELGELANASEILTADILRVVFPEARSWFEAHVEIEPDLDPKTGDETPVDKKFQDQVDGRLRSMMTQQHIDFGLRDRVELSLKETLHHGSFVAEIIQDSMDMYFDGTSVKEVTAPTWKPHSMWNCWPDPSPSLVGTNMFYSGSMFIRSYMPRHKFMEQAQGEGWIPKALKKIPKEEHENKDNRTKDLEIVTYWGDVIIPQSGDGIESSGDDLFFPNYKVILANGKMVYIDAIKTPYPPLIYKGYEKMDVRDPYFTSPIIKQSPMQKIASMLSSEYVNGVQLELRPPIVYDGNDPDFIVNGGPVIEPGAKTSTKGAANFKVMETGNPNNSLTGIQFIMKSMSESLGRPGVEVGNRATREEVVTKQADSEAGMFGFAVKLDAALRTFLYMQHAMNVAKKDFKYSYYNPEIDSNDFLRISHDELPHTVNFEVVGSKGMLGEARRNQAFVQAVSFASGNPMFQPLLEPQEILKQVFTDAGVKNAERFMKQGDIPPDLKAKMDGMMGVIQKLHAELEKEQAQTEVKTNKMLHDYDAKMKKIQAQHETDIVQLASKHHLDSENQQRISDAGIAKVERIVREVEHKIEMIMALEKKEKKEGESAESQGKENKLTNELIAMHEELKAAVGEIATSMTKPRKIIRDEQGRVIGSEVA